MAPGRAFERCFSLHGFCKVIDVNQHTCESFRYTREEFLSLSIEDIDVDVIAVQYKENWKQMLPGELITLPCPLDREESATGKCLKEIQLQWTS